MSLEIPTIEQLQEKSLLAGFDKKQQAYFDKLIDEYLKQFRGMKDADLKARFEQGDREALSLMRAMIAKRQQIIDFIGNKEIVYKLEKGSIGLDDKVTVIDPENKELYGKKFIIASVKDGKFAIANEDDLDETYQWIEEKDLARFYSDEDLRLGRSEEFVFSAGRSYRLLDLQEYMGINVGDHFVYTDEYKAQHPQDKESPQGNIEVLGFGIWGSSFNSSKTKIIVINKIENVIFSEEIEIIQNHIIKK